MPDIASMSNHSASRKPKLDRRNARKIVDYEPSTPSPRSSFRDFDRAHSFRVVGYDSKEEIDKICEKLGLSGGADAFSIPAEAWEAGKAKSGSLERFILDSKTRTRSLVDDPSTSFPSHRNNEFPSSRLASAQQRLSPLDSSMSSTSGDSFASDVSLTAGEKVLPGHFGTGKDQTSSHFIFSEPQVSERPQEPAIGRTRKEYGAQIDRQNDVDGGISGDPAHTGRRHIPTAIDKVEDLVRDVELYHDARRPSGTVVHGSFFHEVRIHPHDDSHRPSNFQKAHDFTRMSKSFDEVTCATTDSSRATLRPPPVIRGKSDLLLLSTQELLAGFGPSEEMDHNDNELSEDGLTSPTDSEDFEADDSEDETKKQLDFVSKAIRQRSHSAKEQIQVDDGGILTPPNSEGEASDISIQNWRKLDTIGSGSFGTVYEALSEDGMYFAVKEVSLSENNSRAQQCVTQLEQEIDFLSKFHHENIVRYLGTQKESDKLYIFLELVTKGSLSSLYQKHILFDSQIRSYTRQILSGLQYLHARKIMHRDIKCANILVDVSGKVKLADFGLAKQISQLGELKSCKGSAYWMAPEVINPKKTYSIPADIWSLGCTVLEMITRQPPFGDVEWYRVMWMVGNGEPPPIPKDLSDEAKDFIKECLQVEPASRPSASQLLKHPFVQYTGGSGLTPRTSFEQTTSRQLHLTTEGKTLSG